MCWIMNSELILIITTFGLNRWIVLLIVFLILGLLGCNLSSFLCYMVFFITSVSLNTNTFSCTDM